MKIAVQLYSVRDCISNAEDFFKVLEEIKAMGYEGVEFAGFHGVDAASLKAKRRQSQYTQFCNHVNSLLCNQSVPQSAADSRTGLLAPQ